MDIFDDEAAVEHVAKELYAHHVQRVRKQAEAIPLDTGYYSDVFLGTLEEVSDRATAITAYALFDDMLSSAYKRLLDPAAKPEILLGAHGPLHNSYDRARLALALKWIGKDTFSQVNLIRKIRNSFAHHIDVRTFDHIKVAGLVDSFRPDHERIAKILEIDTHEKPFTRRQKYIITICTVFRDLVSELTIKPFALVENISHESLTSSFDNMPENIKDLSRKMIHVAIWTAHYEEVARDIVNKDRHDEP